MTYLVLFLLGLNLIGLLYVMFSQYRAKQFIQPTIQGSVSNALDALKESHVQQNKQLFDTLFTNQQQVNTTISQFTNALVAQQESSTHKLQTALGERHLQQHKQLQELLHQTNKQLHDKFAHFHQATERHMLHISESMQNHLSKGFEKTNETFTNITKRLAIIDDAQKKITTLSENVVNLQDILRDKRARGAFGEMQLKTLIDNLLPPNAYAMQYTLSTGVRADCILFLPDPTGHIVIDAKFPLENYQRLIENQDSPNLKQEAIRFFKQDIKKHITDIHSKYIIPNETTDGAVMFIPAEAIFAEIHANHIDLVEFAFAKKVWMASPSTLMAILTTAQSVIKDDLTRQQIHVIQKHLRLLSQDFGRFEKRMDNLTKHLQQANSDAEQVHTSAKKIAKKFTLIEQVELQDETLEERVANLQSPSLTSSKRIGENKQVNNE